MVFAMELLALSLTLIKIHTLSKWHLCTECNIVHCWIQQQHTSYFYAAGQKASRTQFPLQNSFALTIHKTQGLTLQKITVSLDHHIFSPGQAYVAISRCPTWENLNISALDRIRTAFITDSNVVKEYERIQRVAQQLLITFSF